MSFEPEYREEGVVIKTFEKVPESDERKKLFEVHEWWTNYLEKITEENIVFDNDDLLQHLADGLKREFNATFKEIYRKSYPVTPNYCEVIFENEEGFELFKIKFQ